MNPRARRLIAGCAAGCAVALATLGEVVVAQQPAPGGGTTPAWIRARLENRLDPRTRVAVERVIDSAHAAGVPAEPLVVKALEGASKGAQGAVIVRVVRDLAGVLTVARQALGESSLAAELTAGADAIVAGVEPGALARLRRDRAGQPLVVTLGVLTELIARNVPVKVATQNVLALTEAGIADEQLVAFRREVERDIGIGAPPAAAATLRASGLTLNFSRGGVGNPPTGARQAPSPKQKP
jgi:hypothetical protein